MLRKRASLKVSFGILNIPKPTLEYEEERDLKNLFNSYDPEKTGKVNPETLLKGLKESGCDQSCRSLYEIVEFLNTKDNREEGITFNDFIEAIKNEMGYTTDEKELRRLFELFLKDKTSDYLGVSDLKATLESMNMYYDVKEIRTLLQDITHMRDSMTFEEFKLMITEKLIISN